MADFDMNLDPIVANQPRARGGRGKHLCSGVLAESEGRQLIRRNQHAEELGGVSWRVTKWAFPGSTSGLTEKPSELATSRRRSRREHTSQSSVD
jgi:hypothetical protein